MLAAGRLHERIRIRQPDDAETGNGGFDRSWATVAGMDSIPAEVIGISGREAMVDRALQGVATYRITIRRRSGIEVDFQVIWLSNGNLELNIVSPPFDPTGRRELLQIIAESSIQQNAGD